MRGWLRENCRTAWALIALATGITGIALFVGGDRGGHHPLRAVGGGLIGIAFLAFLAYLWSRRGGTAPPTPRQRRYRTADQ